MKYVFGPVPSRRLGQSLGIDPVPFKTCNWNCVYCQLGRTSPLENERRDYAPREEIVAEVTEALERHKAGQLDWLTFVGSGETTLHAGLGWMIRQVKSLTAIPVAVITNGSLLYQPDVREELLAADAVLPSLDAGSEELYLRINRPAAQLSFRSLVDGLTAFGQQYHGRLWVEVMLLKDLNDSAEALRDLAHILRQIGPDEVHINMPTRPPAEAWIQPASAEGVLRAKRILGDIAKVVEPATVEFDPLQRSTATGPPTETPASTITEPPLDAIIAVIRRHPMPEEQLIQALDRWDHGAVGQALAELKASGQVQVVTRGGQRYWSYAGARYVETSHPGCRRRDTE